MTYLLTTPPLLNASLSLELSPGSLTLIILSCILLTVLAILPLAFRSNGTNVDTNSSSPVAALMLVVVLLVLGTLLYNSWTSEAQPTPPVQDIPKPLVPDRWLEPDTDYQQVDTKQSFTQQEPESLPLEPTQITPIEYYVWQVGSFTVATNAQKCQESFQRRGFDVGIEQVDGRSYRVFLLPDRVITTIEDIKSWARSKNVGDKGHFLHRQHLGIESAGRT